MAGRELPFYVTRANEQAFAPPYRQDGAALHGFALPAARPRLQALCDRFVAGPSGGRLRPRALGGRVLLYFCDFARSHSHAPDDAARGWLGEREFGVWIPVALGEGGAPCFLVHTMVVDSGPAMCSGREVLGLPKEIGGVTVGREPGAPLLAADVLTTGGGRGAPGAWRPLVDFERVPGGAAVRGSLADVEGLIGGDDEADPGDMSIDSIARGLASAGRGVVELLSLKQFRDAADPRRACYQAVVRSRARVVGLRRAALTGSYAYRIHGRASHPLVDELGVASEGRARGLYCEGDLDFEAGEEI